MKQQVLSVFRRFLTRRLRSILWYLGTFGFALIGPIWVYRLRWSDMRFPWRVADSDLSSVYSIAQALGQSWFGFEHRSLGAPARANLSHAFIPDDVILIFMRVLTHLVSNPITGTNLFYVFTFGASAVTFLAFATRVGIRRPLATALAITYAWLPYHFTRMTDGHVALAAYFMLPIGAMTLLHLHAYLQGQRPAFLPLSRSRRMAFLAAPLLVGSSGAYYGLFFALLAGCSVVFIDWSSMTRRLTQVGAVGSTAVLFMLAPILRNQWATRTGLYEVLTRSPDESLQFGGSLSRLFLPWGVWLPAAAKTSVAPTFFEWTATPLLGSISVFLLLTVALRSTSGRRAGPEAGALAAYGIIALFFYATGGFGYIFALIIDPAFRTWNRMSIVILTFGLALIGLSVQRLRTGQFVQRTVIPVALVVVAVFTQLTPLSSVGITAEPDTASRTRFLEIESFGRVIERKIPEGCSILQLPLMLYPEGGMVGQVGNGNHLWLPLVTSGFRWSYGAPKGTREGDFWKDLIGAAPESAVQRARELGFCAVVIDERSGIDPRALKVSARLKFVAKEPGGYWLYLIKP